MDIPSEADFAAWNINNIDNDALARMWRFFDYMKRGTEALGPRFSLATMALRSELNTVALMMDQRHVPRSAPAHTRLPILPRVDTIAVPRDALAVLARASEHWVEDMKECIAATESQPMPEDPVSEETLKIGITLVSTAVEQAKKALAASKK